MTNHYSEQDLIVGIKDRNRDILKYLYQQYFPMIVDFVLKNSGSRDDAQDLFQEGLVVVFEKTHQEELELRSTFKTYFYAICRNKWLMVLRKKRSGPQMVVDTENFEVPADDTEKHWQVHEQYQVMQAHFKKLGEDCQKVLKRFLQGNSLREIAAEMGFTEKYAKKRKFICQKKLIESIEKDVLYKELIN
ncbi:MAG: RNA polymerase sigma factor [Cyclobacteriaceae bacterium]